MEGHQMIILVSKLMAKNVSITQIVHVFLKIAPSPM